MTNSGRHVTDSLVAYVDGELDALAATRVAEHLLACRSCRQACETIRLTAHAAGTLRRVPAPDGLFDNIEASIDRAPGRDSERKGKAVAKRDRWPMTAAWMSVAMTGIVIFTVVVWTVATAPPTAFEVTTLEGSSRVERRITNGRDMISAGEWLETDSGSRALIRVKSVV